MGFSHTSLENAFYNINKQPQVQKYGSMGGFHEFPYFGACFVRTEFSGRTVDGKEVSVKDFRGKVLLIDFWATWCGPCVAEIPNLKKTYAKLHKKGFEIVGISLDSSEQKLTDYVNKNSMGWPQYFDGKGWNNTLAKEYGISSIPAMWLVDKNGKLVDMNARGGLEGKIEKLLTEE